MLVAMFSLVCSIRLRHAEDLMFVTCSVPIEAYRRVDVSDHILLSLFHVSEAYIGFADSAQNFPGCSLCTNKVSITLVTHSFFKTPGTSRNLAGLTVGISGMNQTIDQHHRKMNSYHFVISYFPLSSIYSKGRAVLQSHNKN